MVKGEIKEDEEVLVRVQKLNYISDLFQGVLLKKNIKDKRIKITAYIKTSELRSDGIEVKVHVQKLMNNVWSDTFADNNLASKIENTILNEARNLRISANK